MVKICFLATLGGTIIGIPAYMKLARRFDLVDEPEWGKIHTTPTSTMGGLTFLLVSVVVSLAFTDFFIKNPGFLIGLLLVAALGFLDDLGKLPRYRKIKPLWTLLAVGMVMALDGLNIPYLFSPLSGDIVPLAWGGPILVLFLVFCKINSVNFIDGIDGLAAGLGVIGLSFIGGLSFATGQWSLGAISMIFLGSVLGFLFYNFPRASIFMGDVGSLSLGFVLAVLAIRMTYPMSETGMISLMTPVYVLGLTTIDTIQVVMVRVVNRENIFRADTKHLHHKLMRAGLSERETTLTLYGLALFLAGLGVGIAGTSLLVQFWLFVGLFFAISGTIHWLGRIDNIVPEEISLDKKEPLGQILLKIGALEKRQLEKALKLKEDGEKDKMIGELLKEQGAITEEDLHRALLIQSRLQVDER